MTKDDFMGVLDSWANKKILEKVNDQWSLKIEIT